MGLVRNKHGLATFNPLQAVANKLQRISPTLNLKLISTGRRESISHQVFPLDALNELLVELLGHLGSDVESLLNGQTELVVHFLQQTRVAILSGISKKIKQSRGKFNMIGFGVTVAPRSGFEWYLVLSGDFESSSFGFFRVPGGYRPH